MRWKRAAAVTGNGTSLDELPLEAADGELCRKASCARTANEKYMKLEKVCALHRGRHSQVCYMTDCTAITSGVAIEKRSYDLDQEKKQSGSLSE